MSFNDRDRKVMLRFERQPGTIMVLLSLLTLLGCASISSLAQIIPGVLAQEDTQQWNDIQLAVELNKQVDFNLYSTFRIGRDISHLVDRRVGGGFTFRFGKYLTVAPNYLNIVMRPGPGRKVNENRLTLPITVRIPIGKFLLSDRSQFERRLRFPINSTRYRNRVHIEHPIKIMDTSVQLFVSNEVFYDWFFDAWVRNRFAVGVNRRFNKHFTGDVYYMRQNDGRSRPGDLHIIGAVYRLRF